VALVKSISRFARHGQLEFKHSLGVKVQCFHFFLVKS
jgi:hypothetical protein